MRMMSGSNRSLVVQLRLIFTLIGTMHLALDSFGVGSFVAMRMHGLMTSLTPLNQPQ